MLDILRSITGHRRRFSDATGRGDSPWIWGSLEATKLSLSWPAYRQRRRRRNLVTTLVSYGTNPAQALAVRIVTCLEMNARTMALDEFEGATLLAVLKDPPDGLVELRGALARDHRDRL